MSRSLNPLHPSISVFPCPSFQPPFNAGRLREGYLERRLNGRKGAGCRGARKASFVARGIDDSRVFAIDVMTTRPDRTPLQRRCCAPPVSSGPPKGPAGLLALRSRHGGLGPGGGGGGRRRRSAQLLGLGSSTPGLGRRRKGKGSSSGSDNMPAPPDLLGSCFFLFPLPFPNSNHHRNPQPSYPLLPSIPP